MVAGGATREVTELLQFSRKEEGKRGKEKIEEKEKEGEEKEKEGTRKRRKNTGLKIKKQGEEGKGIIFDSIVGGEIRITDRSALQRNFALSQISSNI